MIKVTKNVPEPAPVPPTTYDIVGLTQAQFDVIVGCVQMAEAGTDVFHDGYPAKNGGRIANATGSGGKLVFDQFPRDLAVEAIRRLERRSTIQVFEG